MENNESNYQVNVNNITYDVNETTKNGIQTLYVQGKMKFEVNNETTWGPINGVEIKGKRNEVIDFKVKLSEIINEYFQNENNVTYKFQLNRIMTGKPMLGMLLNN
jgi:hypothetical protein